MQVKKLIAGPGVYVCDECVELCNEILDEDGIVRTPGLFKTLSEGIVEINKSTAPPKELDEKTKSLIGKSIKPLEELVDHYHDSRQTVAFEAGVKSLLIMKVQTEGKFHESLLPYLERLSKHYILTKEYPAAASVFEWYLKIVKDTDRKIESNQMYDLVRAFMNSGNLDQANEWLRKLETEKVSS